MKGVMGLQRGVLGVLTYAHRVASAYPVKKKQHLRDLLKGILPRHARTRRCCPVLEILDILQLLSVPSCGLYWSLNLCGLDPKPHR